jgi:hypothetical protein
MLESPDYESGDSFIMTGTGGDRDEDLYLSLGSGGPASDADHDFIAAARQDLPRHLPRLLAEVDRLRKLTSEVGDDATE